jgi:hypothetical protein
MVPGKLIRPWLTLGVRLSVFPVTPQEAPADLWEQVVGVAPETDQNQPRQHLRVQTGPWRGGVMQLTVSSDRFVWLAGPSATPEGFPDVENWSVESVLPEFIGVITQPWLNSVDFGIKRVGFGLHSLLSAQDMVSAYRLLEELVPSVKIEPEETTEFFYQINRPKLSRVLNVRLNRLMKWSVLFFRRTELQFTPERAQTVPVFERRYASLDNDVNTPAENLEPLDNGQLGAIYDELVELAWKNLEVGEKA